MATDNGDSGHDQPLSGTKRAEGDGAGSAKWTKISQPSVNDLLNNRTPSPRGGLAPPKHRWGMAIDADTGLTQTHATISCVVPANVKPIDQERARQEARREQGKRLTKFIQRNKAMVTTALPPPSHGRHSADLSRGKSMLANSADEQIKSPAPTDSELLALCKGVVQEAEIPRLAAWLKTAKEQHRANYLAVFGALHDTIALQQRSIWKSSAAVTTSMPRPGQDCKQLVENCSSVPGKRPAASHSFYRLPGLRSSFGSSDTCGVDAGSQSSFSVVTGQSEQRTVAEYLKIVAEQTRSLRQLLLTAHQKAPDPLCTSDAVFPRKISLEALTKLAQTGAVNLPVTSAASLLQIARHCLVQPPAALERPNEDDSGHAYVATSKLLKHAQADAWNTFFGSLPPAKGGKAVRGLGGGRVRGMIDHVLGQAQAQGLRSHGKTFDASLALSQHAAASSTLSRDAKVSALGEIQGDVTPEMVGKAWRRLRLRVCAREADVLDAMNVVLGGPAAPASHTTLVLQHRLQGFGARKVTKAKRAVLRVLEMAGAAVHDVLEMVGVEEAISACQLGGAVASAAPTPPPAILPSSPPPRLPTASTLRPVSAVSRPRTALSTGSVMSVYTRAGASSVASSEAAGKAAALSVAARVVSALVSAEAHYDTWSEALKSLSGGQWHWRHPVSFPRSLADRAGGTSCSVARCASDPNGSDHGVSPKTQEAELSAGGAAERPPKAIEVMQNEDKGGSSEACEE